MKKTGAFLTVYALEQIGVRYTFGMPGVHNLELYDELHSSKQITPILVTHEGAGSFIAEGYSRMGDGIGTMVVVPAAGMALAMAGIGEAYLDGVPLLVISGGTRRDSGRSYQLHQLDQGDVLRGITKGYYLVERHEDVISTLYTAYETAVSGEPGPVFVEIPVEVQMFAGDVAELTPYKRPSSPPIPPDPDKIKQAVDLLTQAKNPGIFVGWGAVQPKSDTVKIAERLVAPVATSLQGISAFSYRHPLHTGFGMGETAVPSAQKAFAHCDALLAVGVRFSELATGSYSVNIPQNLIHIDINPAVFDKNYPAKVAIPSDSAVALKAILTELEGRQWHSPRNLDEMATRIQRDKDEYMADWTRRKNPERVSPGWFFQALRRELDDDAVVVVDDGKHTFLTAELFPIYHRRGFIGPTDFNCMGYAIPAAIGAKFSDRQQQVVAIVGDGGLLMTGMELLTAVTHKLGVIIFVFKDGELGYIAQAQQIPFNRKTCTTLGNIKIEGIALATGAHYLPLPHDNAIERVITEAMGVAKNGRPVLVEVNIDYSQRTAFTKGIIKTNLARFAPTEKARFIGRAVKRRVTG